MVLIATSFPFHMALKTTPNVPLPTAWRKTKRQYDIKLHSTHLYLCIAALLWVSYLCVSICRGKCCTLLDFKIQSNRVKVTWTNLDKLCENGTKQTEPSQQLQPASSSRRTAGVQMFVRGGLPRWHWHYSLSSLHLLFLSRFLVEYS